MGFSVSSTVDSMATTDQIIEGWEMLNHDIGTDIIYRLFKPFFLLTVADAIGHEVKEIRVFEPRVIETLRFSDRYLRLKKNDKTKTFSQKVSEIKGKLTMKALSNVESYQTSTIEPNFVKDIDDFQQEVKSGLLHAKKGKPLDTQFERYIKELRRTLWSVIAEFQMAGLCHNSGLTVSFDKPKNGKDYDILIEGLPCQVKSVTTEDDNARELFRTIDKRIIEYRNGKKIDEDEVENGIKNDISYRYKSIVKAIDQVVKIVLINGLTVIADS